jgi:hypothetical protein
MPELNDSVPVGMYRHYKGNLYMVIGVSENTETGELDVVYHRVYDKKMKLWHRPISMFKENVEVNGNLIPRFKKI